MGNTCDYMDLLAHDSGKQTLSNYTFSVFYPPRLRLECIKTFIFIAVLYTYPQTLVLSP